MRYERNKMLSALAQTALYQQRTREKSESVKRQQKQNKKKKQPKEAGGRRLGTEADSPDKLKR